MPVLLMLGGVSRMAASLRNAGWDDESAPAVPSTLSDLDATVRDFGGAWICGCGSTSCA